jgi:hypothetical protein
MDKKMDGAEDILERLTRRVDANGWRVISQPRVPLQPEGELKELIDDLQRCHHRSPVRSDEGNDTPEAA